LKGKAEAISHGAATIINAIATGKGAAIGVDLRTKARVKLTNEPGIIESTIMSDPTEDPVLIEKTVRKVLKYFNLEAKFGAKVETWSNIPIARGMKSSSAAGNAIALATVAALKKHLDDVTIVRLSVDGAIDAKVTITGAFDDACASYFGGVVFTDNLKRRVVKRLEIAGDLAVLFYVPAKKTYTVSSDVGRMKGVASLVKIAYKEALGYDSSIATDALIAGALAAGLSGTGPAVTAIVPDEKIDLVKDAWQTYEGEILEARVNHEKAEVVG
jgi:shikimate kinase